MPELKKVPGTDILYREWPAADPQAVFLLVHGIGAHSERWQFLAKFFLEKNISSYALELKGFGDTAGLKGHISSFKEYYRDINQLSEFIRKELPGKKIFLIGESMGALICFVLALVLPGNYEGLICISPAFKSKLKFSFIEYLKIFSAVIFNKKKVFPIPFDEKMCTRDAEYSKIMEKDPRELRYATAGMLFQNLLVQLQAKILASKMDMPNLFLLSGIDTLVSQKESNKIFKKIKVSDKKLIEYPEMKHALSIDLGREKVFGDIWEWIRGKA
ncbi:alpha/beta fold hydrolase [Candidatus Margulisiibacteriota bacterium]